MELVDGQDYVVTQMWDTVRKSISYSNDLMRKLFATIGVMTGECSPFCQSFYSPEDLGQEFIRYLPRTFTYENSAGNGVDDADIGNGITVDNHENTSMHLQEAIASRIKRFANEMAEDDEKQEDSDMMFSSEDGNYLPSSNATLANYQELMTLFQSITNTNSADDILCKVLAAIACLEQKDNVQGANNLVRKAKSLVQRWLTKPANANESKGACKPGDTLIERDVVVLINAKVGSGASASNVALPHRVVDIYDKHYNKWFMSKTRSPAKIWKKETKPYKLKVRLLNKDAINVYSDVELCDNSTYKIANICRIIVDEMIIGVVGKLEAVGL